MVEGPAQFQTHSAALDEEALSRMDDEGGAPDTVVSPTGAAKKSRS
jgi:hypothetical protein